MTAKRFSEYADRNGAPIQDVLVTEFASSHRVLEIGSGTGQHAARFAAAMPHLTWQCSDLGDYQAGLEACVADAKLLNFLPPLLLDVRALEPLNQRFDAVYSSNTAHIMSIDAVEKMFGLVGAVLISGGLFCLYGPFRQGGEFNTASNAAFDRSLRLGNSAMGIRDLEALDEFGSKQGIARIRLYSMPANNHLAVWRKEQT